MSNGFGAPKYNNGSSSVRYNTYRIKEGSNVYRIFPPMKSNANNGRWAVYHKVHWGYFGVDQQDKSKKKARPFECVREEDRRTRMITVPCDECVKVEENDLLLKDRDYAARLQNPPLTEEQIDTLLAPLKAFKKDHNLDSKWYLAVMTPDGEFGVLLISHRTKKQLDTVIEQLRTDDGVDPLALDQGVWFDFHRTGKMREAQDTVQPVYEFEVVNGKRVKSLRAAPITAAQAEAALNVIPDLNQVTRVLSREQVKLLVNCSGDPEEVDSIIGMAQTAEQSPVSKPHATPPALSTASASVPAAIMAPSAEDVIRKLQAELAALRGSSPTPSTPAPQAGETTPPTTKNDAVVPDANMSNEDFMKLFAPAK